MTNPSPQLPEKQKEELRREWKLLQRAANAVRSSIARLLRVDEEDKPRIYTNVFNSSEFSDLNYWLEILFSIGIATLGLIINSPAVVIGAMLISPLMGPIIASGLAIALGDFYLGFKSIVNVFLSTVVAILLAAFITWILPFRSPTAEILARVQPTLLDLGVAVLSGMAGAVVMCRGGKGGGITALPGVAVAVALMPPLGVVGFGVGVGWDWGIIRGGGLLYLTNLVAIIMSSFVVFFAVRMDAPATRRKINEWLEEHEKAEAFYDAIQRTPLRHLLGRVGTLPQRVLTLTIFLAMVSFPLGRTLLQLRDEAYIRRAVSDELHRSIPVDAIVREDLTLAPDLLQLRVVAMLPEGFPDQERRLLEERVSTRTNRPVKVTIFDVATREEVEQITGRIDTRGAAVPATVEELRAQIWARLRPAIALAWPTDAAPLAGYRLLLEGESGSLQVELAYLAEQELGRIGEESMRRVLRDRTGAANLQVTFARVAPEQRLAFRSGSDVLTPDERATLSEVAATLLGYRQARLAIQMLVRQSAEETAAASELDVRRAEAVRQYLITEQAIPAERIETQTVPAADAPNVLILRILPPVQP
ncbi:MAG TPA: DUF389 domain-containing protein [Candidatus Acidoferrales bacterium]